MEKSKSRFQDNPLDRPFNKHICRWHFMPHYFIIVMGKNIFISFILLLTLMAVCGCASRGEIKRFQQQTEHLIKVNEQQQQKLMQIDSLLLVQLQMLRELRALEQYNMQQVQDEMKVIENILKERGFQVSALSKEIENIRQEMIVQQHTLPNTDTSDTVTPESQPSISAKQLYETAQLDLNRGKYELAQMEFLQFVELFPASALADDAQYYAAECSYSLGKYQQAITQYLLVRQKYPQSSMVPSALYKASLAAIKLDDLDTAERLLKDIIKNFPSSEEAPQAKEKLKEINRD